MEFESTCELEMKKEEKKIQWRNIYEMSSAYPDVGRYHPLLIVIVILNHFIANPIRSTVQPEKIPLATESSSSCFLVPLTLRGPVQSGTTTTLVLGLVRGGRA